MPTLVIDEPTPDEPLPGASPTWLERELARRMRDDAESAKVQRESMTAALDRVATATGDHNTGAKERHVELLAALRTRDTGAEAAIRDIAAEKSRSRRWLEAGVVEAWAAFKTPLAGLVTAGCAYYAWGHFQIPAASTAPVSVAAPTPPQDGRASPGVPVDGEPDDGAAEPDDATADPVQGDGE